MLKAGIFGRIDFVRAVMKGNLGFVLYFVADENTAYACTQGVCQFPGLADQFQTDFADLSVILLKEY
jgi:hypothetical protein